MVYPLGVDVFLSQKARKGAAKSRAVRGVFYVAMFAQINSGHKIGALFYQQKTR